MQIVLNAIADCIDSDCAIEADGKGGFKMNLNKVYIDAYEIKHGTKCIDSWCGSGIQDTFDIGFASMFGPSRRTGDPLSAFNIVIDTVKPRGTEVITIERQHDEHVMFGDANRWNITSHTGDRSPWGYELDELFGAKFKGIDTVYAWCEELS